MQYGNLVVFCTLLVYRTLSEILFPAFVIGLFIFLDENWDPSKILGVLYKWNFLWFNYL